MKPWATVKHTFWNTLPGVQHQRNLNVLKPKNFGRHVIRFSGYRAVGQVGAMVVTGLIVTKLDRWTANIATSIGQGVSDLIMRARGKNPIGERVEERQGRAKSENYPA